MNRKTHSPSRNQIVYGVHPVTETVKAHRRKIFEILLVQGSSAEKAHKDFILNENIQCRSVTLADMNSICGPVLHQGIVARVGAFPYVDPSDIEDYLSTGDGVTLILDEIQDPQNLGGILRSAECFGVKAVLLSKDRSALVTPAVEKASAGATAHIPVCQVGNLARAIDQLKNIGFWVYGAHCEDGANLFEVEIKGKVAFAVGSEGKGVRRLTREKCDVLVNIPPCGRIQSLSVTSATSVLLAEVYRRSAFAIT